MFPLLDIVVIILGVEILAFGDGHGVVSVYSYGSLVFGQVCCAISTVAGCFA